jgi:hypothetical protein
MRGPVRAGIILSEGGHVHHRFVELMLTIARGLHLQGNLSGQNWALGYVSMVSVLFVIIGFSRGSLCVSSFLYGTFLYVWAFATSFITA